MCASEDVTSGRRWSAQPSLCCVVSKVVVRVFTHHRFVSARAAASTNLLRPSCLHLCAAGACSRRRCTLLAEAYAARRGVRRAADAPAGGRPRRGAPAHGRAVGTRKGQAITKVTRTCTCTCACSRTKRELSHQSFQRRTKHDDLTHGRNGGGPAVLQTHRGAATPSLPLAVFTAVFLTHNAFYFPRPTAAAEAAAQRRGVGVDHGLVA